MAIRVLRFNRTQRIIHWLHALSFLVLLGTGLSVYLPPLASVVGNRLLMRHFHLWSAILYLLGPVVVARLGYWKSVITEVTEIDQWEPADLKWLRRLGIRTPSPSETGRFNAGQKLNATFTGAAGLLFGVTGLIMWQGHHFPQWLTQNAILLHDGLTWLALAIWLGHIYFSAFHPYTRESLRGMVLGWVRSEWAERHHPRWYIEVIKWTKTALKNENKT